VGEVITKNKLKIMEIVYIDTETNIKYFDTQMVMKKLKVCKSRMHRLKSKLPENSYISWNNLHLYNESAIEKLQEIIQKTQTKGYGLASIEYRKKMYEMLKTEFENSEKV
jgi:hypothetical protein